MKHFGIIDRGHARRIWNTEDFPLLYDPLAITGMLSFFDADFGTYTDVLRSIPATADSDPVASFTDQKSGYDVKQSTNGIRPILKLAQTLTGKSVIQTSGSEYLEGATNTGISGSDPFTMMFAYRQTANVSYGTIMGIGAEGGGQSACSVEQYGSNQFYIDTGGINPRASLSGVDLSNGDFYLVTVTYDGTTMTLYLNGVSVYSGSITFAIVNYPLIFFALPQPSYSPPPYSQFGKVQLSMAALLNVSMDAGDQQALESYIADKVGIQI